MAKFAVYGTMMIDVEVIVEADSLDEAMDYADENVYSEEYCNDTVGLEVNSDADERISVESLMANGYIDWGSEWCEEVK